MKGYSITAFTLLALIAFACTDNNDTTVFPMEPEALNSFPGSVSECRANMRTIASQQIIYFATNSRYANTLEELGMAGTTCPGCGLEYIIEGTECDYSIHCPLPSDPTHGSIINGVPTWVSIGGQTECRANMRTIASANYIFYAGSSRYADSLEELGFGSSTCPGCGNQYTYYTYDNGESFYLSCPLPPFDCHGFVDSNSGYSWSSTEARDECRANMRTIASQEVIYFAYHSEYTENLEDLGLAGVVCPGCGDPYVIQVSENGEKFYLECGMPTDPTHGHIDNGVASWRD